MQILPDAITVLGSRHGLFLDPVRSQVALIRFDRFDKAAWFGLRAGVRIGKRTVLFPLCPQRAGDSAFTFLDQRLGICSFALTGIDAASALKVTLTVQTPFRPRDAAFSTTPVILIEISVEHLAGQFRWEKKTESPETVELFCELDNPPGKLESAGASALDLVLESTRSVAEVQSSGAILSHPTTSVAQTDRLCVIRGERRQGRFSTKIRPRDGHSLVLAWCSWSQPVLEVSGELCPFRYTESFASLNDVADWARHHALEISSNARRVESLIAANTLGPSVNHLLAWTLHSWMACTWWATRPDGRDWFSVWEGSCYFHSTVDVEFTQAPFYLALWPELLEIELDFWPEFAKSGESVLGPAGRDALFLSHDCGILCLANGQCYPHEMEVEETANWILLCYAHSRRTGRTAVIQKHAATLEKFLRFLIACDTTDNGVPDKGVANTIDDASPAVQFGSEQTYLAVKTLAALETGAILATESGLPKIARAAKSQARKLRATIKTHGWQKDHYAVLLKKSGELTDPWTGHRKKFAAIPGWNAAHIYTANTLPLLDMCGFDLGLPEKNIVQDLVVGAERCLREYGCLHSDFTADVDPSAGRDGLAGQSANPGWVSMNMIRDLAAIYRDLDFTRFSERYWNWQVLTSSQEPALFFETFGGNNLKLYPRGVAIWGIFDAVNKRRIDKIAGIDTKGEPISRLAAPDLLKAAWIRKSR